MITTDRPVAGPLSATRIPVHRWEGVVSHHKQRTVPVARNSELAFPASDTPSSDKKNPCKPNRHCTAKRPMLVNFSRLPESQTGLGVWVQRAHGCVVGIRCSKRLPLHASPSPQILPVASGFRHCA